MYQVLLIRQRRMTLAALSPTLVLQTTSRTYPKYPTAVDVYALMPQWLDRAVGGPKYAELALLVNRSRDTALERTQGTKFDVRWRNDREYREFSYSFGATGRLEAILDDCCLYAVSRLLINL